MIDVLTTAPWMFSLGDMATSLATCNALCEHGVPAVSVDEYRGNTTVIGGGHVLGHMSELRHFIVAGTHLLNAVGVHDTPCADWSYLKEYRYLSVRDQVSAEVINMPCNLVPCPAVLLHPTRHQLQMAKQRRTGHVVAHKDPIVERAIASRSLGSLVVVDPQPERLVQWNSGGTVLPVAHDPRMLIASLVGAHAVVCRSLHLSIFAMAAGAPFCCIDTGDEPQSNKMKSYWQRAGLPEVMYDGDDPVRHASGLDFEKCRSVETGLARLHIRMLAQHCNDGA